MSKFRSCIENEKYSVKCTERTIYLYDKEGNELARFKDLIYITYVMFSPDGEKLLAKSNEGLMAYYSLRERKLIKKFRFGAKEAIPHNDGLCFSPDGKYLYNIECHINDLCTRLSVYDTSDFSLKERMFADTPPICVNHIEYDKDTGEYYILGFERKKQMNEYFICTLKGGMLERHKYMDGNMYFYCLGCMDLKLCGFTEESYRWSWAYYTGKYPTLETFRNANEGLADIYIKL